MQGCKYVYMLGLLFQLYSKDLEALQLVWTFGDADVAMAAMPLFGIQEGLEVVTQRMTHQIWSGEHPIKRELGHAQAFVPDTVATWQQHGSNMKTFDTLFQQILWGL